VTHQAADEKNDQLPSKAKSIHPEAAQQYKTKAGRKGASTVAPNDLDQ
jgi:hypothetical protein